MCEYCDLVSGDEKEIARGYASTLSLERHNNTYSLIEYGHDDYIEKEIAFCPMCR